MAPNSCHTTIEFTDHVIRHTHYKIKNCTNDTGIHHNSNNSFVTTCYFLRMNYYFVTTNLFSHTKTAQNNVYKNV